RALSAPLRIGIVLQLREGPRCVHELVDALGVTQPLVSQHLRVLKASHVVSARRRGRESHYELIDHSLRRIVEAAWGYAREESSTVTTTTGSIGVRSTRQRSALTALLDESKGFRSAQDLHAELRERGDTIGRTTVYRTLQSMSDAGAVDVLRTDSGELIFRKCSDSSHHHLVCRDCGYTVEVV